MDKKYMPVIISLILSLISITIIFLFTFDKSSFDKLSQIQINWLMIAILLHILSWVVWGLRISVMSGYVDRRYRVNLREGTSIALSNLFLAAITPSMAGGEPVRIRILSKKGMGTGKSTALVLGERVFDGFFILALIPISLYIFSTYIKSENIRICLTVGLTLFIAGMVFFVYSILRPQSLKRILKKLAKNIRIKEVEKIFHMIDEFIEGFQKGIREIFKMKNKTGIIIVFLLTAVYWFLEFLIPSCILKGLNQNPIILQSISAQILLVLLVTLPLTPGASGIAEGGAALLYSAIIPDRSTLGLLILTWRFITYYMNIFVGGLFQYKFFKSFFPKEKK
ncbi:MAG: flippase-like domain-containing protein [Thermoplasmata archaeon]|nr:MAG: flippase-like domain-containing protein [Thermoplasmata archaeon]KAA0016735.1 MAG: flippase-like domain-containing protein [Thermoplasmata archaeon]